MRFRHALLLCLGLAACGQSDVNPPTEPARPVAGAGTVAPEPTPPPGVGSIMPGAGPANFMGLWAANTAWCGNTTGAERPILITVDRFEGYENACAITQIDQTPDGYIADLACRGEGTVSRERVRMTVDGDAMRLTWLTRANLIVPLRRCARPDDVTTKPKTP